MHFLYKLLYLKPKFFSFQKALVFKSILFLYIVWHFSYNRNLQLLSNFLELLHFRFKSLFYPLYNFFVFKCQGISERDFGKRVFVLQFLKIDCSLKGVHRARVLTYLSAVRVSRANLTYLSAVRVSRANLTPCSASFFFAELPSEISLSDSDLRLKLDFKKHFQKISGRIQLILNSLKRICFCFYKPNPSRYPIRTVKQFCLKNLCCEV